jgi:hypothetical protein
MENKTIYSEVDLSIRVSPLQSSDEDNNIDSEDDDDFGFGLPLWYLQTLLLTAQIHLTLHILCFYPTLT